MYCSTDLNNDFKNMTRKEYFKHTKTDIHIIKKNNKKVYEYTKQKLKVMDKVKYKMSSKNYKFCKDSNFNHMINMENEFSLERNDFIKLYCSNNDLKE